MLLPIPAELLAFKIPTFALEGNSRSDVPLDRTHVFRFPNNKGLSVTCNERGDIQISPLIWESYRLTSVKRRGGTVLCTKHMANTLLTKMISDCMTGSLTDRETSAMRHDLAALIQIGVEERDESFNRGMSPDGFSEMPDDPSPSLDWAAVSMVSLSRPDQDVILGLLSKPYDRLMCINSMDHYLRVACRKSIEAGQMDEAVEFLTRLRDSQGILAYDDMLIAAANYDLVNDARLTRDVLEAIAKRPDAYSMDEIHAYFVKSENQSTDVRYLTRMISQAKHDGVAAHSTLQYDAKVDAYVTRVSSYYEERGYQRASYEQFQGKPAPKLSNTPVNAEALIAHLQNCYGRQGIDPFVGMSALAESTNPRDQLEYRNKREQMLGQISQLIEVCRHKIALKESAAELSPVELLIEHFNDIGSVQGIVPTVTLGVLNSYIGEMMRDTPGTVQEKVEWYINKTFDIFLLSEMKYQPVGAALGDFSGWPASLIDDTKRALQQAFYNNFGRDSVRLS